MTTYLHPATIDGQVYLAPLDPPPPVVVVDPPTVTDIVVTFDALSVLLGTQQFHAQVNGTNNPSQAVTWQTTLGSISSTGLLSVTLLGVVQTGTVTATSVADPTISGSVQFSIAAREEEPVTSTTLVKMRFLTPDGEPVVGGDVTIQLKAADSADTESAILMPRPLELQTNDLGELDVSLLACDTPYYVTVYDSVSEVGLNYRFYVPESASPVRLQDIIIDKELSSSFDEAALQVIVDAKAEAVNASLAAQQEIAQASQDAVDAMNATVAQASTTTIAATTAARDIAVTAANDAVAAKVQVQQLSDAATAAADTATKTLAIQSDMPPGSPVDGQEWLDSVSGRRYEWLEASGAWAETFAAMTVDNPVLFQQLGTKLTAQASAFDALTPNQITNIQTVGTTRVDAPLQALVDDLASKGGGAIFFPPGLYRIKNLYLRDKVKLWAIFGTVTLKLPDGVDGQVLANSPATSGDGVDFLSLSGLIVDGNKANAPRAVASSAAAFNTFSYLNARDCIFQNASGYGLGLQSVPGYLTTGGQQTNAYLENVYFLDNGDGSIGGTDTYDGLDIKYCDHITLINCYSHRNKDKGINPRGKRITIIGGSCESNGTTGYEFGANINTNPNDETRISVFGAEATGNAHGFAFNSGADPGTGAVNINVRYSLNGCRSYGNTGNGYYVAAISKNARLLMSDSYGYSNGGAGFRCDSPNGAEAAEILLSNCDFSSNTGAGARTILTPLRLANCQLTSNGTYGFYETDTGSRSVIGDGCVLNGNTLGPIGTLSGTPNKYLRIAPTAYDGASNVVDSAATITLPLDSSYVVVNGVTTVTNITPGRDRQRATLRFSSALTVTDGGNLILNGNFVTTSNDVLQLICDGTNWFEISRSVN